MLEDMVEPPRVVRRLEVITGTGRRRRWSADEQARILEEVLAPGAVVSEVARRHGMTPQHLFTWRRQARLPPSPAREPPLSFVPAVVSAPAPAAQPDPASRRRPLRRSEPSRGIELEIASVVVRIGAEAGEAQIAAVIRALKATA